MRAEGSHAGRRLQAVVAEDLLLELAVGRSVGRLAVAAGPQIVFRPARPNSNR